MSTLPAATGTAPGASQTERAILGLRDAVLRGHYRPGARLAEVDVAAHLGVSRTPARAALQRLAAEGLLENVQPAGYVVRAFSAQDIADAIEVRGTVEGLAARLAAERGVPDALLERMRDCLAGIDAVLAGAGAPALALDARLERYAALNERFHALVLEASGSPIVQDTMARTVSMPFASPNAFVAAQARRPGAFAILQCAQMQHHAIVDAIAARAGARVEALMKEHARIAHRNLEAALQDAGALERVPGGPLIRRA
ncbi:GntR family transcriptional regulator [uncultured Massilia sp.]|uniref:GntR family transcriptional regulator n=1 Tax=uncultured Massilia sp. TaxID=169973 RepID=UPI0025E957D3|nr:GntR family transcriptional regulator [uncultured Massilia sp.]